MTGREARALVDADRCARMIGSIEPKTYYMDRITATIRKSLKGSVVTLSDPRVDRLTLARQLTAKVQDDRKNYRVLILPDNAVVTIDGRDADDVFGGAA